MNQLIDLGFRARPWQDACFRRLRRYSVIVVHRRGGKTILSILRLIDQALRKGHGTQARYAYIAPQRNQAKTNAWDYIKHYATKVPGVQVSEQELWVEFPNGARIRIYGADDPDALRGQYFDGVVLDEVAQMKVQTWGEIVRPALMDRRGWALFIGTPKGINLFSKLYFDGLASEDWYCDLFTCYQTGTLPPDEIEKAKQQMSETEFRQEMLCDFSASASDKFITIDIVQPAAEREAASDIYDPFVVGVDPARFGDDKTVFYFRKGRDGRTHGYQTHSNIDTMEIAAKVMECFNRYHPDRIFIDEGGIGAGVVDRCRELRLSTVQGINFAQRPDRALVNDYTLYANKRAEMWGYMRDWLQGGAIPADPALIAQLTSIGYMHVIKDGREAIQLQSKDELRRHGLPSPDIADALALTFAYPVQPSVRAGGAPGDKRHASLIQHEYDPFQ